MYLDYDELMWHTSVYLLYTCFAVFVCTGDTTVVCTGDTTVKPQSSMFGKDTFIREH